MRIRFILASTIGSLLLPTLLCAQTAQPASLLVLSKQEHILAVVNPTTLKVTAKIPVGDDPHEVIASADGSTAYVSNYGGGTLHTLAVIDLKTDKALAPIDVTPLRGPHGLTFVGGKTWFTVEGSKAIARYDPATHKVDWVLGTGQNRTHMIYVSADEKRIVTTNVNSGTVSILDLEPVQMPEPPPPHAGQTPPPPPPEANDAEEASRAGNTAPSAGPGKGPARLDWNQTVVRVGHGSEGFDISPDHREVWVANAQDGTISIVDLAAHRVLQTLAVDVESANRLKFTPDGKHVLVSTLGGPDLIIIDAATRKEVKRLPIGHGAAGILMQPDGARAFVACTPDNYVAIIDLNTLDVAGHLETGGGPDGMAWATHTQ